jgi:hypothetical protein
MPLSGHITNSTASGSSELMPPVPTDAPRPRRFLARLSASMLLRMALSAFAMARRWRPSLWWPTGSRSN